MNAGKNKVDTTQGKMATTIKQPNVQVGAIVNFLGAKLATIISTNSGKNTVLAQQIDAENAEKITLSELGDRFLEAVGTVLPNKGINTQEGLGGKITDQLPDGLKKAANTYTVQIKQAALLFEQEQDSNEAKLEYALWVQIDATEAELEQLKEAAPFNLISMDNIYLKVWNTENLDVLETLDIKMPTLGIEQG